MIWQAFMQRIVANTLRITALRPIGKLISRFNTKKQTTGLWQLQIISLSIYTRWVENMALFTFFECLAHPEMRIRCNVLKTILLYTASVCGSNE